MGHKLCHRKLKEENEILCILLLITNFFSEIIDVDIVKKEAIRITQSGSIGKTQKPNIQLPLKFKLIEKWGTPGKLNLGQNSFGETTFEQQAVFHSKEKSINRRAEHVERIPLNSQVP